MKLLLSRQAVLVYRQMCITFTRLQVGGYELGFGLIEYNFTCFA